MIVGAGVGGLATAARLAHRGHLATVLEKTDQVGGRDREIRVGECRFDAGPTLMMMLDPFKRLFEDLGERIEDHLDLRLCDPSYRTFFADCSRIDGTPNTARMVRQIEALSGEKDALAYPKLLGELASLYETAVPNFVRQNWNSPLGLFTPARLGMVAKHHMLANLYRRVSKFVDDPRLRMLFSFQTMYLGLSPFEAPWVYAVLTYMEYGEGIWYPMGGMTQIGTAIAALATSRGAEIRLNSPVAAIDGKSVRLESGEVLTGDAVICNADLPYAESTLLSQANHPDEGRMKSRIVRSEADRLPKSEANVRSLLRRDDGPGKRWKSSCSAMMFYLDYEGELPNLLHHNVFFGKDYRANLDALFHDRAMPDDPAFYACISARTDPSQAAPGHLNLYILVPCQNLDRPFGEAEVEALRQAAFRRLACETDFDPALIRAQATFTPPDWQGVLNLDRGAAFGLAHNTFQSACFRPSNRSRSHPGLYYVGASTYPGNGLPMVLISAELAEQRLVEDLGL